MSAEELDVLVVGAGQAGLGTAYEVSRRAPRARILLAEAEHVGIAWERRWESLRLFTPRRFSALPGLDFPDGRHEYPDRLEMAAYLQAYAAAHRLPVREHCRIERLHLDGAKFCAHTAEGVLRARQVVIAAGPFALPHRPPVAEQLGPEVRQLHSATYRRPDDVPAGAVAVVGGGNSAAQLAVELADHGRAVHLIAPREPWYLPERVAGRSAYWILAGTGALTASTTSPLARYIRRRGDVVVGTELRDRLRDGRIRLTVARVSVARPGRLLVDDGPEMAVSAVLWCTGYRPDTSWLDLTGAVDGDGTPVHRTGAGTVPGLHWMGLPWQSRLDSSLVHGVGHDAERVAARIASRLDRD